MSNRTALQGDFLIYLLGYGLAVILTLCGFGLVYFHLATPVTGFGVVLGLGFLQLIVHMRCFLHMSLRRSARADLMLVLFSILIIAVMSSGTLIVLFNLRDRMM
jgi:cytochrome o ubiquinol oxidase operon protein cyoD